ncbi:MAG TPA: lipocalin-like domain-containing protein [Longimicrobiaceae bacterium]|nr:lipocalin-like domain-containing protein [Longimicrobiaceae bacterium]
MTRSAKPVSAPALVGTWSLVSWESRSPEGEVTHPFGADAAGRLNYDAAGNMAVHLMRPGRPPFATEDQFGASAEEAQRAFNGYFGYFGTYTVQESQGTVTHHVEAASPPNWIGTDQLRYFQIAGDTLTLSTAAIALAGEGTSHVLVWRRIG